MIEYKMTTSDIDRQIELLKFYPEIVVKHYRPALVNATQLVEGVIRPMIPTLSGVLADTFASKVTGKQINTIKGRIGWGDKRPRYAHIIEDGAAPHEIAPKQKVSKKRFDAGKGAARSLRWMDGGGFVFAKKVYNHPGVSAVGFMAAGWSATQPIVEAMMQQAGEAIVKEMAVS